MTIRILYPNGREETRTGAKPLSLDEEKKLVGGWTEVVWVLHKGRKTAMIVNECGTGVFPNPCVADGWAVTRKHRTGVRRIANNDQEHRYRTNLC